MPLTSMDIIPLQPPGSAPQVFPTSPAIPGGWTCHMSWTPRLHCLHFPQLPLVFPWSRTSPLQKPCPPRSSLAVYWLGLHATMAEATSSNCHSPAPPQTSTRPSAHGNRFLISSQLLGCCFSPRCINYPSFISISTSLETELKSFLEQSSFVSTHKWNTSGTKSCTLCGPLCPHPLLSCDCCGVLLSPCKVRAPSWAFQGWVTPSWQ